MNKLNAKARITEMDGLFGFNHPHFRRRYKGSGRHLPKRPDSGAYNFKRRDYGGYPKGQGGVES